MRHTNILCLTSILGLIASNSFAEELDTLTLIEQARSDDNVSTAEILSITQSVKDERKRFHGNLSSNIEIEELSRDDGIEEGKIKFTFLQGGFRHDNLPGWDWGFYSGREELFSGNLFDADYNRGVNSIQELFVNKNFKINDKFNVGLGSKLAFESIDERVTPEIKTFASYKLTDKFDVHGYALYHTEFKRNRGQFDYWEVEPGIGYKFNDKMGMWLNLRYQEGIWSPDDVFANSEKEVEMIIKPGLWYNWGRFSTSVFAEVGWFEKEDKAQGTHLWTEDYVKLGVSGNYRITDSWSVFGQVSYKMSEFASGENKETEFDGDLWGGIVGLNYSF